MDDSFGNATAPTDDEARKTADLNGLYLTLRAEIEADIDHLSDWRKDAKESFDFVAGPGQWTPDEVQYLRNENRPVLTFNETLKFVRAICGLEANNRHATVFLPREAQNEGEVKGNEILSQASDWMERGCRADRQQSRSFRDCVICGVGAVEGVMDYDDDPSGRYNETRCNPLEMGWDRNSRESNLLDARRVWRVRQMALSEARALIPGVTDKDGISAEDLDASWASKVREKSDGTQAKTQEQKEQRLEASVQSDPNRRVTIVQVQWWEFERYHRMIDPSSGQTVDIDAKAFDDLSKGMEASGYEVPKNVALRRRVYRQAFLGSRVLKTGPCPSKGQFTFKFMTWEPDDNKGVWFGVVRLASDPQRWVNKFISQFMHIVNSTAKGGILFESDAVSDPRSFQESYAKPSAATQVASGALMKGKIQPKPGAGITAGVANLLEIAEGAFARVLGLNMEIMGLADRQQPGVLEAQRKQAAMTILATLFDSLSAFRGEVAKLRLYYIQNFLADGRMIRISGEDGHMAIPLLRDQAFGTYDVIVDEAPTAPNVKEKTWQALSMLLPAIKNMLTPEVVVTLLDYVPNIPSKLVEALKKIAGRPNPQAEQAATLEMKAKETAIQKDEAQAKASTANAVLSLAKAGSEQAAQEATRWESLFGSLGFGGRKPPSTSSLGDQTPLVTAPEMTVAPFPMAEAAAQSVAPEQPQPMPGLQLPGGLNGMNGG